MSSGDFEAELQQSVQKHRETLASMADDARARIAQGIATVRPIAPAPAPAASGLVDDPFAVALGASNGAAVRFDDMPADEPVVWEDAP